MADFKIALSHVLKHEGGYVNDPDDAGGETNYGITATTARAHGYFGSMKDIPMSLVEKIYMDGYWRCGQIRDQAVANKITDMLVNMGTSKICDIQGALNTFTGTRLTCDGILGPITTEAINNVHPTIMVAILADISFSHYIRCCIRKTTNIKYLAGGWWTRASWKGE